MENKKVVNGKVAKPKVSKTSDMEALKNLFANPSQLDVPLNIEKYCKEKGLECRWIDANRLKASGGLHLRRWEVFKVPSELENNEVKFGIPADKTVRRGSLLLAVRPIIVGDAHRSVLKDKAEAKSKKSHAQELKQMARDAGVPIKIHEGYENS